MLSASISAMSGCACLPSQIYPWGLKFRLNFFLPDARNGFEFVGLFAIALCICTESSFWRTQINTEIVGPMSARLQAVRPPSLSEIATDTEQAFDYRRKIPISPIEGQSLWFLVALCYRGRDSQRIARPNAPFLYLTNFIERTLTREDRSVASSSLSLCLNVSLELLLELFLELFLEPGPSNGETNFAERG